LREQQRLMAVVVGVTEHLSPCRRCAADEGSFSNLGGPTQVAEGSCRAQPHIRWRPLYGTSGLQLDRAVHRLLHCSVCKFLNAKPMPKGALGSGVGKVALRSPLGAVDRNHASGFHFPPPWEHNTATA
jgi:hypothetical protein